MVGLPTKRRRLRSKEHRSRDCAGRFGWNLHGRTARTALCLTVKVASAGTSAASSGGGDARARCSLARGCSMFLRRNARRGVIMLKPRRHVVGYFPRLVSPALLSAPHSPAPLLPSPRPARLPPRATQPPPRAAGSAAASARDAAASRGAAASSSGTTATSRGAAPAEAKTRPRDEETWQVLEGGEMEH